MTIAQHWDFQNSQFPLLKKDDEMLIDISHELRTPLTAISVALDLISCGQLGVLSQKQQQMVEIATKNTERLIQLTRAIEQDPAAQINFLSTQALAQINLQQDLGIALTQNDLELYYQPIISLENSKILGFEALLRWYHPTLGMLSPDKFIPLAETSNLIIDIGTWVIQQACDQLRLWQNQFPAQLDHISVSVNLSGKHLLATDLVTNIQQTLEDTGLAPENLVLEITEKSLVEDIFQAKNILENIQNLGIRVSIDDFGTGYSSLSRLHELPLDTLKIDRSFVQQLGSENGQYLVGAIINLAENLGIEVIAEGIETKDQIVKLQSLGCGKGQGYFFSIPLDNQAVTTWLLKYDLGMN